MKESERGKERIVLSTAQLHALVVRDFERMRDPRCETCRTPLPMFREPADELTANWHTGLPAWCRFGFHAVIGEVQARLWERYDLERPAAS